MLVNEIFKKQMAPAQMSLEWSGYETTYVNGYLFAAPRESPLERKKSVEPTTFMVIGYATNNNKYKAMLKQVLKFHLTPRGTCVFNNIEPAEYDPVKHTRVARVNVKEYHQHVLDMLGVRFPQTVKQRRELIQKLGCKFAAMRHEATEQIQTQLARKKFAESNILIGVDSEMDDCVAA